jgi:hypothetical protein
MRDLKQEAGFGKGVRAVQQSLPQDADPPSKEAVEAPNGVDSRFELVFFLHALPPYIIAIVYGLFALVNQLG